MERLTVLYDNDCGLCRRAQRWLHGQAKYVSMIFVAAGSPEASRLFPQLAVSDTLEQIHAIDDRGNVYRGEKAWLVCLWTLKHYRKWALRFATPAMMPRAKQFVAWVSKRRR